MALNQGEISMGEQRRGEVDVAELRNLLEQIKDPEIPVISISDLGVLRDVRLEGETVVVVITPTYSGCPAMKAIRSDIEKLVAGETGLAVKVLTELSPPWSTDDMTDEGRRALLEYGIAPPQPRDAGARRVQCPRCGSASTRLISEFGSTACKALYQCHDCLEPFDHFKCI
jgi:ring-1,2-phenylacetyl-CoA epoxidase subunit PaaD